MSLLPLSVSLHSIFVFLIILFMSVMHLLSLVTKLSSFYRLADTQAWNRQCLDARYLWPGWYHSSERLPEGQIVVIVIEWRRLNVVSFITIQLNTVKPHNLIQKLTGAIERVYFNGVSLLSRSSSRETNNCLELGYSVDRDLSSG